MPVEKFRSVEQMPRLEPADGTDLIERIRTLWNRAFLLSPPTFTRGVTRFASMQHANEAREKLIRERMRRTRSSVDLAGD